MGGIRVPENHNLVDEWGCTKGYLSPRTTMSMVSIHDQNEYLHCLYCLSIENLGHLEVHRPRILPDFVSSSRAPCPNYKRVLNDLLYVGSMPVLLARISILEILDRHNM